MAKSAVVSAMGVVLGVVQGIMKWVNQLGGKDEDFYLLSTPEGEDALRQIAQILVDLGKKVKEVVMLVVDYACSLQDAITAGSYDYTNPSITVKNFPPHEHERGKKSVSFKLFHFNRDIESDEAIAEMDKRGFRPASVRELLAYGKANPELQRQFPVIALFSVWVSPSGNRGVAALCGSSSKRDLNLSFFDSRWGACCRFLAVRKSSS